MTDEEGSVLVTFPNNLILNYELSPLLIISCNL